MATGNGFRYARLGINDAARLLRGIQPPPAPVVPHWIGGGRLGLLGR